MIDVTELSLFLNLSTLDLWTSDLFLSCAFRSVYIETDIFPVTKLNKCDVDSIIEPK